MAITIRPAHPADHAAFATLFPELAVDDPLPNREAWARDMVPTTLMAEDGGQIVGYAFFQVLDGAGYVRHVACAPAARRRGVGRALMTAIAQHLRAHGAREWHLNVKPDNVAALALYEGFGMTSRYPSTSVRIAWSDVAKLPSEVAVSARVLDPEGRDDATLEDRFTLQRGLLRAARARQGRVLVMLEAETAGAGLAQGLAVFSPAFPGAFPFRVARPSLAGNLLDALRQYADPAHVEINVVVEDDPALTTALVDAGGERRLEILHYAGPL